MSGTSFTLETQNRRIDCNTAGSGVTFDLLSGCCFLLVPNCRRGGATFARECNWFCLRSAAVGVDTGDAGCAGRGAAR